MRILSVFLWLLTISAAYAEGPAQVPGRRTELVAAAEKIAAQIAEKPRIKDLFDRSFFKTISLEKTEEILRRFYRSNGKIISVKFEYSDSPYSAHFVFETEKGSLLRAALSLSRDTGRVTGLFFQAAYPKNASLESVGRALGALGGRAGFLAVKLNEPGRRLQALNENELFAIGSSFKLYLLGAILEKGYSWKKVLTLKEESRSLPSGRLQNWPDGSPLTLHTLAAAMISESDNTAADALVDGIGRGVMEELLPKLGHSRPETLKPFLKTSELFRLKSDNVDSLRYVNASLADKYLILSDIARKPLSAASVNTEPFYVDKIEWRASPADVCRLMEYFYKKEDKAALEIMAINPGLDVPKNKFLYAGYKGGSEHGVLNMTWLLKTTGSDWYCLTASWNDEKKDLEEEKLYELMNAAINAIGGEPEVEL